MTDIQLRKLLNGDVVQVFINKKWYNGIVIEVQRPMLRLDRLSVYVHYYDGVCEYGETNYFDAKNVRFYDSNVINREVIKKIKVLADKLVGGN